MSLTPEDVEQREFTVTLRGFDQAEVVDFLRTVAADYRKALEGIEAAPGAGRGVGGGAHRPLGRLVPGIDSSSDDFQAVGDQVAEVLRSAAEAAATIRGQARQEAEDMIVAAGTQADEIRGDAVADQNRIEAELDQRRREADERAEKVLSDADREAREIIEKARAHHEQLAQGEHEIAARLRTAVTALDAVLAEVGADSEETLVSP